jgi:hypothetical protein
MHTWLNGPFGLHQATGIKYERSLSPIKGGENTLENRLYKFKQTN